MTRYEEYDYTYDDQGSLLTDSRSKFEWNALGQLTKVTLDEEDVTDQREWVGLRSWYIF
ncbi:hypothetical protein [Cohnella luojiensis]|uniref:hypothetical protein n=1 Tax=Cohnella luojiensis TaxID=652876 RepID=UPI0014312A82|nr:hypothetical protein [Cohnella luojiensis]